MPEDDQLLGCGDIDELPCPILDLTDSVKKGHAPILAFTYTSALGYFTDCSLRVEMTCADSINDIYIDTFSMIRKQMDI